jgi:hypothetical protein
MMNNQDEYTREEITMIQNQSLIKMMVKEPDLELDKPKNKGSKYSQKKVNKPYFNEKKGVRFKDTIQEVVYIESFKTYNKKMCFEGYRDISVESRRSCCEDSKCLII